MGKQMVMYTNRINKKITWSMLNLVDSNCCIWWVFWNPSAPSIAYKKGQRWKSTRSIRQVSTITNWYPTDAACISTRQYLIQVKNNKLNLSLQYFFCQKLKSRSQINKHRMLLNWTWKICSILRQERPNAWAQEKKCII